MPVPPKVLSKLYWTVAIPRMTYGLEVVPVSDTGLAELEHAHRQHAKIVQGLPPNISRPACLATVGWLSMTSYVSLRKVLFLWQILSLSDTNLYKTVALYILRKCVAAGSVAMSTTSPIVSMYESVCKYKLEERLWANITTGSWEDRSAIKQLVKKVIWSHEVRCWKASSICYPELCLYCEIVIGIHMHIWWKVASRLPELTKKISSIITVIMGGQPKTMQRNLGRKKCDLCHGYDPVNAIHIICKCPALEDIRTTATGSLLATMPAAMGQNFKEMNDNEKVKFLLTALSATFTPEWLQIYKGIANFIHFMYANRARKYDILDGYDPG